MMNGCTGACVACTRHQPEYQGEGQDSTLLLAGLQGVSRRRVAWVPKGPAVWLGSGRRAAVDTFEFITPGLGPQWGHFLS